MQNNNNKLRTFIITFIIVIVLLVVGYLLFKNSQNIKNTSVAKKFTSLFGELGKKKVGLISDKNGDGIDDSAYDNNVDTDGDGTADSVDVSGDGKADKGVDANGDGTTDGIDTNGDGIADGTGVGADGSGLGGDRNGDGIADGTGVGADGSGIGGVRDGSGIDVPTGPTLNPFPNPIFTGGSFTSGSDIGSWCISCDGGGGNPEPYIPPGGKAYEYNLQEGDNTEIKDFNLPQCSDGKDNDKDTKIDAVDPGCHTDENANNQYSYDPTIDTENTEDDVIVTVDVVDNACVDKKNPILSADDQKAMNALMNEFFRIAPGLSTNKDKDQEEGNTISYKEFISANKQILNECYSERAIEMSDRGYLLRATEKSTVKSTLNNGTSTLGGKVGDGQFFTANWRTYDNIVYKNKMSPNQYGEVFYFYEVSNSKKDINLPPYPKYPLETKESPYRGFFTSDKIVPSKSFYTGLEVGKPYSPPEILLRDIRKEVRDALFSKGNDDVLLSSYIKMERASVGGTAIASHVLQSMKDAGIMKYYCPTNECLYGENVQSDGYTTIFNILTDETTRYMNTVRDSREAWANRGYSQSEPARSNFINWPITNQTKDVAWMWRRNWNGKKIPEEPGAFNADQDYQGLYAINTLIQLYLESGKTEEERVVNMVAQSRGWWGHMMSFLPETGSDGISADDNNFAANTVWAHAKWKWKSPYESKMVNKYQLFEDEFKIW